MIDRFQHIRTRLNLFDKIEQPQFDRYDDVMPRPAPWLFKWHAKYHHEDLRRMPLSGELYRPPTRSDFMMHPPVQVVKRGMVVGEKCYWWNVGCRFATPSRIEMRKHIQREHLSENDKPAMVDGISYFPQDWWRGGPVTDVRGRRERLAQGVPEYAKWIRAKPAQPFINAARRVA